mmetsp:Transcript_45731/g.138960  ORF Transcript_45731/g.138960 Transcript_45731/m.138960 type:complete len:239 (+) Transcript_45731:1023-1739(+)
MARPLSIFSSAAPVRRIHHPLELLLVLLQFSHAHHVDVHVVLLELTPRLDQIARIDSTEGRADEQDYALGTVLIPSMLEGQGCDLDRRGDVHDRGGIARVSRRRGSTDRYAVQCAQYLPHVVCGADQQFGASVPASSGISGPSAHGDHSDRALGVGLGLLTDEHVRRVVLRLESSRDVISIAHVLGVVEEDHAGFERHGCGFGLIFFPTRFRCQCSMGMEVGMGDRVAVYRYRSPTSS